MFIAFFWLTLICGKAVARDGASWINAVELPPEAMILRRLPTIEYYEVVASRVDVATTGDLIKNEFLPITEEYAKYLCGTHYSCPKGQRPFLFRGVYGSGGTGTFHVKKLSEARVLVYHHSLGASFSVRRTALVVNVDFIPVSAVISCAVTK